MRTEFDYETLKAENADLRSLIKHCWVHSGYQDCGYKQMTSEQKALYDKVIGRAEPFECEGCSRGEYCPDPNCPG